jgi:transcriptional regulator with XRE-family HTH domain
MPRPSPNNQKHPALLAIGESIRASREANGVSQEAFAELAGIDRSYMSAIERGAQSTGILLLLQVAEALGKPLSDILADASL